MREIVGTNNRVLEISLSNKGVKEFFITENDRRMFLGGKGMGLKLLYDRLRPGINPLGEDNILVFMMGTLLGTGAPCSSRFAGLTKSPLTGLAVSSSCGGPFGMAFKTAGYDGLLITGRSDSPVYLTIDDNGVEFKDAHHLWGMDTWEAQHALRLGKKGGALVIGPAGEHKVLYANIASGDRFLGRGGMGAVMGAKNLKAVVAFGGDCRILPKNPRKFERIRKRAVKYINSNVFTSDLYRNYGTSANINLSNRQGILPINNFRKGSHKNADTISGEAMKKRYQTRYHSCKTCAILCGHRGSLSKGRTYQIPEYETIGLLGSNLGIFDTDIIIEWNELCGKLGLDTISAGSTIAWFMEAGEKGLTQTDLRFGQTEGISDTLKDIALRRGIGDELANGTRWLSKKYGGSEFAIQVKGLEMAAYDPRGSFGQGLAYAVANRGGCHLSAFLIGLESYLHLLNPCKTKAKPQFTKLLEDITCCINSLQTCQFTMYAYTLEPPLTKYTPRYLLGLMMQNFPGIAVNLVDFSIYKDLFSAVTGIEMSNRDFLESGDRIHVLERFMNTREGISRSDDTLPARLLKEGRGDDPKLRVVPIDAMLNGYYKMRGYDSNGIPDQKTLERLGISVL